MFFLSKNKQTQTTKQTKKQKPDCAIQQTDVQACLLIVHLKAAASLDVC